MGGTDTGVMGNATRKLGKGDGDEGFGVLEEGLTNKNSFYRSLDQLRVAVVGSWPL